jgi:hypothetical protein
MQSSEVSFGLNLSMNSDSICVVADCIEDVMKEKISVLIILAAVAVAFVYVIIRQREGTLTDSQIPMTREEIERLFPCVYFPGQASPPGAVEVLAHYCDSAVVARIETFESAGFDRPEISWAAILRTVRVLKGECEPVYSLSIQSPQRNFGQGAQGRLFLLFLHTSGGRMLWALEPWLPENEDIASGG